ncbi:MAG: hypothetical protein PGN07_12120 [Aeromicrobium erythreum]
MVSSSGRAWRSSALALVVLALAAAGAWGAGAWRGDERPALGAALDSVPAATGAWSFTDWQGVRAVVGRGASPSDFVGAASRRDLATRSVLASSADEMQELLGWSPRDLRWESYGISDDGEVAVLRLGDDLSPDRVERGLREADFTRDGNLWVAPGGASTTGGLPDLFGRLAVVPDRRVVVIGSDRRQVDRAVDVVRGRRDSLADVRPAAEVARQLVGSQTALVQLGRTACAATAVGPEDEAAARAAVDRAGALRPFRAAGRGLQDPGGAGFAQTARFAMVFGSDRAARDQAPVRERLSTGAYVGRTGRVEDSLRLTSVRTQGPALTLAFRHDPSAEALMVASGPALFAACRV